MVCQNGAMEMRSIPRLTTSLLFIGAEVHLNEPLLTGNQRLRQVVSRLTSTPRAGIALVNNKVASILTMTNDIMKSAKLAHVIGRLHLGRSKKIGYHFRAHPKLDPHHFFVEKMLNFSLKPFVNHQISVLRVLIKGCRGSVYRQQQRIPTSRFKGRNGADGRIILQRHKQRNACIEKFLIVCQSCRRRAQRKSV
jgi:hypothetical protein